MRWFFYFIYNWNPFTLGNNSYSQDILNKKRKQVLKNFEKKEWYCQLFFPAQYTTRDILSYIIFHFFLNYSKQKQNNDKKNSKHKTMYTSMFLLGGKKPSMNVNNSLYPSFYSKCYVFLIELKQEKLSLSIILLKILLFIASC